MKFRLDVPKVGKILDLKKELSKLVDISPKELFVTEVYNCRFFKEFCDGDLLSPIRQGDKIYVHQIAAQPPLEEGEEEEEEEEEGFFSFFSPFFPFSQPLKKLLLQ